MRRENSTVREVASGATNVKITNRGIYRKFNVTRTDGSSEPGGKHEHCKYFVLDLEHDPFAKPALRKYAEACRETVKQLRAYAGVLHRRSIRLKKKARTLQRKLTEKKRKLAARKKRASKKR